MTVKQPSGFGEHATRGDALTTALPVRLSLSLSLSSVSQSLLSSCDILTIGGLGIDIFLPQSDSEFIFRFVQPPPQPQSGHDDVDATLPMPPLGEVDIDRTLPPPDEAEEEEGRRELRSDMRSS